MASHPKLLISPPRELLSPLKVAQNRLLLGPGPTNLSSRVIKALTNPVLGHMNDETFKIMDEVKSGLKYLFQTNNKLTLAISASGHSGMEACLSNLLEPNDTILIIKSGLWGERAEDMSTRLSAKVKTINVKLGVAVTLEEIEIALIKFKPDIVFLAHSESSTGFMQPLIGIGDLILKYNSLFVVDAVASLGAVAFRMDEWKIDAAYSASQKAIGAPPGLTPISFNKRAEKKLLSRKTKPCVFYWDMKLLGNYWDCFNETNRFYHHTISTTLLYGLREALAELIEQSLMSNWKRHEDVAKQLHQQLIKRGFKLFVQNPNHRLPTVTAFHQPQQLEPIAKLIIERMMKRWNIEITGGLGPTTGKIFRIGLMGINAKPDNVDKVVIALDEVINYYQNSKL